MYSVSPLNSWKYCDCENNNLGAVETMKKIFSSENKLFKDSSLCSRYTRRQQKPLEIRKEEVLAIRNRFPTKIPVIVHRFYKETHLPQLEKSKFLVPQEITMSQFQTIIRNKIRLNPNQALYLLVNNKTMMSFSLTLAEIYSEHSDNDGFLYVTYASQEVFGSNVANCICILKTKQSLEL